MSKSKRSKKSAFGLWAKVIVIVIAFVALSVWFFLFRNMTDSTHVIFIKAGESASSVMEKVEAKSRAPQFAAFRLMASLVGTDELVHEGRYEIGHRGAFSVFRSLYGGHQSPVRVTIPSVRKLDDLAKVTSSKLSFTKSEFMSAVSDSAFIDSLGYNRQTILGAFTPNTYDVYWNVSARTFIKKMVAESDKFWTSKRLKKAEEDSLTRTEVIILASIVQEETNVASDKPIIAGLYINRLRIGMPLQACPTIRYALNDFSITRIYENMLQTDSPYNTYKYRGLPPGPIRNPNPEDVDAVLHYDHNDYLYMCASAKLDGTHHFTKTYEEHKAYSVEYDAELNRRQIK